jgi:Cu/Ag efflux protein CusF
MKYLRAMIVLLALTGAGAALLDGEGVVIETAPQSGLLTVDHNDIPGFMAAMQMGYNVANPGLLKGIKPGDHIRFKIDPDTSVIQDIEVIGN